MPDCATFHVTFGPEMPGFGSWEWVGQDLCEELSSRCRTSVFRDVPEDADVAVFVKFLPPSEVLRQIARRMAVVFCPVDVFGDSAEIESARSALRLCSRILVHNRRLARWFQPMAPVDVLDHHVKYVNRSRPERVEGAPILWTGVRTNLPALAAWCNQVKLPAPLLVLTNHEGSDDSISADEAGFSDTNRVTVRRWSPELHLDTLAQASAAIDIRGDDFRDRHKPATKAFDFIAAGVPVAMNRRAPAVSELAELGFECAVLPDADSEERPAELERVFERWFSTDYQRETTQFGAALRELLSRRRIGNRMYRILQDTLATHTHRDF